VAQLLEQLGLAKQYVAVEVNLRLVPRPQHAQHALQTGDRVEIVTLTGGG
jgi:thiamine biosynthesis protein ThiS